jgi:branched-subunit amino acid ABC-type transport system permease component
MISHILDIVTSAAILYVVAAGLLVVFGVMKIINFAHGGFLTIGGYCAVAVAKAGINPLWAIPASFVFGACVGMLVERVIVRPLYQRPLDAILATWGLSIVIGQLITIVFDRGVQLLESPVSGTAVILGEDYSIYRLGMIGIALAIGLVLAAVLHRTRLGLLTRAVIMNEDLARALGIDSGLVRFVTFSLGAGLACLAGTLITPLSSIDPSLGITWLVNAFMLVLVSGFSLVSLAIAALVLGGAQVLISSYFNPVYGSIAIVIIAALLLRFRPKGFSRD